MPSRIAPVPQWRQATVSAVAAGPPPTVTLDIDGGSAGPVRYLAPYRPVVNDVVWLVRNDADWVVVGKLADGTETVGAQRIATTKGTSDSAGIGTTEATVRSVTAALVTGRIYRVYFRGQLGASNNDNDGTVKIREDNASGTILQSNIIDAPGLFGQLDLEAEYTAASTGNKTFVVTLDLTAGTGNVLLKASTTEPDFLYVDYIRG